MPPNPIHSALDPIRARQRVNAAFHHLMVGLSIGAILAFSLTMPTPSQSKPWGLPMASLICLLLFTLAGTLYGYFSRRTWQEAAHAADSSANLKDRAITALELSALPDPSPIQSLALADAQTHLASLNPAQVVPWRPHPYWRRLLVIAAFCLLMAAIPRHRPQPNAPAISPHAAQTIQKEADKLIEELKKAEDVAATQNNPALKNLVKDLKNLAQELKDAPPEPREALSKLSQMQNAVRQEQAKFNTALAQEHLKALGQALAANPSTAQAGKALQEGKNEEAAKALDEKTSLPTSPAERQKLAKELKDAADKMQESGLQDLAQATQKLSDSAREGSSKDFAQGAQSLGKLTRQQDQRKKNDEWMNNQLSKLDDAKQQAAQPSEQNDQAKNDGQKSDGQGQSQQAQGKQAAEGNQQSQGKPSAEGEGNKSGEGQGNKPGQSNQWSTGAGGDPLGDPTRLDSRRQQEQLTGKLGESGDSESQTTHTSQGTDKSRATYKESHQRYQKLSESVLETEPLPLGQRQTIRKYFESIRPQDTDK